MEREMASASPVGIQHLPYDILFTIFSYLPIPEMARCAAVCKQWHDVVTGFTHLWKGKRYLSDRNLRDSDEIRAILHVLPLMQEVVIEAGDEFAIDIFWPRLVLLVSDISHVGAVLDFPRIRCSHLSINLNVAESLLSCQSTVDFTTLRKLRIVKAIPTFQRLKKGNQWRTSEMCQLATLASRAEYTISSALELCPNLKELSVYAEFLSVVYLERIERIGQLRALEIECPGLEELVFLQYCSDTLEELVLKGCADLPSAAYVKLRCLGKLQKLRLRDCYVTGADLGVAATGLTSLKCLQLEYCDLVSDLSFLRHCSELEELRVNVSPLDAPMTGLRNLPPGIRRLWLVSSAVTAEELSEALPCLPWLEELNVGSSELRHLRFLRFCPQLRRLCLELSCWSDMSELSNLRYLTRLESLDLTRCRLDADILSGVMPLMPELDTLSLSRAENVVHLRFLRHCPRLRSLSLFYTFGMEMEALQELCHLKNLQYLCLSENLYNFAHGIIQPCLPRVKIHCPNLFK